MIERMRSNHASLLFLTMFFAVLAARPAHSDIPSNARIFGPPTGVIADFQAKPIPPRAVKPSVSEVGGEAAACRRAVDAAGRAAGVPDHLMSAIARIESGRRGSDGVVNPWPWSINAEGIDHVYETRQQVIAAVQGMQAAGMRSIDVGCMQVNLLYHPSAFVSLEQAFDPVVNATYAARFLLQLFRQTGSWTKATAFYHSANPELGDPYQRKVQEVLAEETAKDLALAVQPVVRTPGGVARLAMGPGVVSGGSGALMLSNRSEAAKIIPLAGGGSSRNLDAYRSAPIRVAGR